MRISRDGYIDVAYASESIRECSSNMLDNVCP